MQCLAHLAVARFVYRERHLCFIFDYFSAKSNSGNLTAAAQTLTKCFGWVLKIIKRDVVYSIYRIPCSGCGPHTFQCIPVKILPNWVEKSFLAETSVVRRVKVTPTLAVVHFLQPAPWVPRLSLVLRLCICCCRCLTGLGFAFTSRFSFTLQNSFIFNKVFHKYCLLRPAKIRPTLTKCNKVIFISTMPHMQFILLLSANKQLIKHWINIISANSNQLVKLHK